MSDIRDEFIKQAIRILRRDGFKQETLEWVLGACWSNGASLALFFPSVVDNILDKHAREAFAVAVIEEMSGNQMKSRGFTRKDIEAVAADVLETEDCLPFARLSAEIDWLVGRRSAN